MKIKFSDKWIGFLAGALMPLAFAPFRLFPLAIICPAVLLALWLRSNARGSARIGLLFGLGFFTVGISWIYVSLHRYGHAPFLLASTITVLFILIQATYIALVGWTLNRVFCSERKEIMLFIGFPALWVFAEWVRSWFFTGFPWLTLGYSQTPSPLFSYAPLFGVYGISYLVLLTSGALVYWFTKGEQRKLAAIAVAVIWAIGLIATLLGINRLWVHPVRRPLNVSVVQSNIPQELKWEPTQLPKTLAILQAITKPIWGKDIIVWPEAAIPYLAEEVQPLIRDLKRMGQQRGTTLISGIPVKRENRFYNGLVALGHGQGEYLKRHLVPFGEFFPLKSILKYFSGWLMIPMSDFSPGPGRQEMLKHPLKGQRIQRTVNIAPFICYEIAFPNLVYRDLTKSDLMLVISDDSWFGHSIAVGQHIQMAQFRAMAGGRPVIFSNNTGPSALIDANGHVTDKTDSFSRTVLTGKVQPMVGITPITRYGTNLIIGLVVVLVGWGIGLRSLIS